jgi:SagB-type dehydrogenase family enzyme
MDSSEPKIGQRFQQETKYFRPSYVSRPPEKGGSPAPIKVIPLPPPSLGDGPGLWKAIRERRSIRDYRPDRLSQQDLAGLLWATQGVTEKVFVPWYRTSPSAGALHPIDTYLIANRVEGLQSGVYFFHVVEFSLALKRAGDFSRIISQAALNQDLAADAAVVFVWVAVIQRSRQKYRQRAYRYIYLDCGHIAQNLYLAAGALNLGCCGIAAFFDDEVNDLVGVDGQEETAIYLAAVGKK